MAGYYAQILPDTQAVTEFAGRGLAKSIVWVPGRMVDQVQEMLDTWRKNDTSGEAKPTPFLPVIFVGMEKGFSPAPLDYARTIADWVDVMIPSDPLERVFKMRAVVRDMRVQVAIVAPEGDSAHSLAMQLHTYACETPNRRFYSSYPLAGIDEAWPVVLELPDLHAVSIPPDEGVKNLTILTVDIQMRATIPMLKAPATSEANDGKGDGSSANPSGYLVVVEADGTTGPSPDYVHKTTWVKSV